MKLIQAYHLLILFSLTTTSIATYSKVGCEDMCGKVRIPYPFGIGTNCSINSWFVVDCNSSTPYLSALDHLQVLNVSLDNQTVTVNTPKYSYCQSPVLNNSQTKSINLGSSPFLFSKSHNKFVFEGCGNAVMTDVNGSEALTGCSTKCHNDNRSDRNKCFGMGCCETTIPHYLKSYNINISRQGGDERANCGSAFLVDENSYVEGRFLENKSLNVPVSLLWTLSEDDKHINDMQLLDDKLICNWYSSLHVLEVDLVDGTTINSWKCVFNGSLQGDPYLSYGDELTEECSACYASGNEKYCHYDEIYDPDSVFIKWNLTCGVEEDKEFEGVIEGGKIPVGAILGYSLLIIFLSAISNPLYNFIKEKKDKRDRNNFFKRNGGLLLKQQQEADSTLVGKTILFTSQELVNATDNFNENRILGRGGQGTVYKGMLIDGRIVAVKKSKLVDESQLGQFINEVVILSQVNHRNVVKLLGCCLETEVPILVSEFIPNGTLYDHLHNKSPISLNMRLQIAIEVAGAVAYLHSATSIPIYHRDIKTSNILLNDKYRAKVSDFGTSKFVAIDQTHLTTLVKGTFGYFDPEYFQSSQFTEKSDVYSFGVVLVELLTGEKPISVTKFGEKRSLATHFMLAMEEGHVMSIFDATMVKEGTRSKLLELADLAMRCLNRNGKNRPTMKEVAIELQTIGRHMFPLLAKLQSDI